VYLYGDVNGMFCCCGCQLLCGSYPHRRDKLKYRQEDSVWLPDRSAAILHLRHHRLYGHAFPKYAEKRLIEELKESGEKLTGKKIPFAKYYKEKKSNLARFLKLLKSKENR